MTKYWNKIFIKPYMRWNAFIIGMMLGHLVARNSCRGKSIRIGKVKNFCKANFCPVKMMLQKTFIAEPHSFAVVYCNYAMQLRCIRFNRLCSGFTDVNLRWCHLYGSQSPCLVVSRRCNIVFVQF